MPRSTAVAARDDPPRARLGPKPARPDYDREIGQPSRNRSNSDQQNYISPVNARAANSARQYW